MAREFHLKTCNIGIMAHVDAGKTTTTGRIPTTLVRFIKIGETHEGASQNGLDGARVKNVVSPITSGRQQLNERLPV